MSADDQVKLRKRLEAMLKLPENAVCVDCRKRGPRWASANLGVFICIECSGIHRNLGVHISFVRSVNLDSWTKKQVDHMEEWGNKRANDYYEANMPASVIRPKEGDAVRIVERFIRDKYEHKRYIASSVPAVRRSAAVESEPVAPRGASVKTAQQQTAPAPKPVTAAAIMAAPVKQPDLLDIMDYPASVVVAPVVPTMAAASADDFGSFVTANSQPQSDMQTASHGFSAFESPAKAPAPTIAQTSSSQDFMDFMSAPSSAPSGVTSGPAVDYQQQAMPTPPRPQASADAILSLYSAQMNRGPPAGNGMMPPPNNGMNGGYPAHMGAMPQPPMMNRGPPQMPAFGAGGVPTGYQQHPGMMGAPPNPFQQQQMQQQQQMMMMHQQQQQAMMMGQQQGGYPQQQFQQPPPNPFRPQQQGNGMMMGAGGMIGQPLQQQPNGGWPGNR